MPGEQPVAIGTMRGAQLSASIALPISPIGAVMAANDLSAKMVTLRRYHRFREHFPITGNQMSAVLRGIVVCN